ncbi:VWA domain-containing protein [bacterium]|nr:VWA domain-containing protein [bacterium]
MSKCTRIAFLKVGGSLLVACSFFTSVKSQEEVTVTRVTVWVKATEKSGKPVAGLTEKDFELYEDGRRMNLTCFEEIRIDPQEIAQTTPLEIAPNAKTLSDPPQKRVVLLMDLSNTSQSEFLHLKQKTTEFLSELSRSWEVSLLSLFNGIVEINVEGTKNADVWQTAFEKIKANNRRDIDLLNRRRQVASVLRTAGGRREQQERVVNEACALAEEFAQLERAESRMWLNSLRQFDKYVRRQEESAHTVVLFLSGGISSTPGKQYYDVIQNSDLIRAMFADELEFFAAFPECRIRYDSSLNQDFEKLVGKLNANNITFYTINSRGPLNDLLETVRESDRQFKMSDLHFLKDYQDFLVLMAEDSGGTHFENSLNFKRGYDAILQDLNHQYMLCYKPQEHSKEGYHKIQVKTARSGLKLRHRKGYYD